MSNNQGFTLIEIIVVMGVLSLIYLLTSDMVIDGFRLTRYEAEQATAVETARKSMSTMTADIRGANASERGDYTLAIVEDDQLSFYNDVNDDSLMEKIRYYLDGTDLVREIYLPGATNDYSVFDASSTIASYVNNGDAPIFSYYNSNSEETAAINDIKMIGIYIMINVTPAIAPNDYILESRVNLRNLKDY